MLCAHSAGIREANKRGTAICGANKRECNLSACLSQRLMVVVSLALRCFYSSSVACCSLLLDVPVFLPVACRLMFTVAWRSLSLGVRYCFPVRCLLFLFLFSPFLLLLSLSRSLCRTVSGGTFNSTNISMASLRLRHRRSGCGGVAVQADRLFNTVFVSSRTKISATFWLLSGARVLPM